MSQVHGRLLLVDDEPKYLEALARLLELRGFQVTTAASGVEALYQASRQRHEVAIVDLKLPGMRGEDLIQALRPTAVLSFKGVGRWGQV